jgi:hypothetical protein
MQDETYDNDCHDISHVSKDLLRLIEENPGIRYRDLSKLTGLCNGVLSYNLGKIERSKKCNCCERKQESNTVLSCQYHYQRVIYYR